MKKLLVIILCFAISGCSGLSVVEPTATATATITPTLTPTITPLPTATYTPEPLTLANFSVEMKGVGEHGNMICVTYQGKSEDLDGFSLRANTSQGDIVQDIMLVPKSIDGETCFDLVDAKYITDIPVSLEIIMIGEKNTQNIKQVYSLENYKIVPWMVWYFGSSNIGPMVVFPNPLHPDAYDITGTSSEHPNGEGHPVYSPCNGKVLVSHLVTLTDRSFHNFWLYCQDTGYGVHLGHMESNLFEGDIVTAGSFLGRLYPDQGLGYCHTHTNIWISNNFSADMEAGKWVDIFNPQVQLGGEALSFGFWLPASLPEQVKELIEKGVFAPNYNTPRLIVWIY
jgi:hypothetical protein